MNPWIIVGTIVWLGCGFVGRCMMKGFWIKSGLRQYWSRKELMADIFVLLGLFFLICVIYIVAKTSRLDRLERKNLWGLML